MRKQLPFIYVLTLLCCIPFSYGQTTLGFEDFDGNAVNLNASANVADYLSGGGSGGDVFGRVDGQLGGNGMPFDVADDTAADVSGAMIGSPFPADTRGIAGQNTTAFFALNDMDGVGVNNATWTFTGFGSATLTSIAIDIAAMGDFEAATTDGFLIEASVDAGPFQEIFRAATDESASKTYRQLDSGTISTENDPLELFIDGSATSVGFLDKCDHTTGNFDTYTSTLLNGTTATSVTIRLSWAGTPSGSEPMGIDNITISGTPAGPPQLVISEIMYNPNSSEDNWEWVEIYNAGTLAADLSGFVLDDNNGVAHGSANIASGTIPAGGSAILYNADDVTAADFMAAWGTVNLIAVTNWSAGALNNGGDTVGIWEDFASYSGDNVTQANVIDNVPYDDAGVWPTDNNAASIYLTNLAADNDNGANWAISTDGGTTPLFEGYTSTTGGGNSGNDIGSPGIAAGGLMPLLISEVTVTPTAGEFIEIYNPNAAAVDLTDVYLTDATFAGGSTYYYNIVTGTNAGGGGFGDFLARFPNGASIAAGEYQTVAISGSDNYTATYGTAPTYELYEDAGTADAIPDMLEGLPGSINGQGGLTNSGEVAILFYWDGTTDLVTDLDYILWGDTAEAVDKTGITIDGPDADAIGSTYANDTPIANQELVAGSSHSAGDSFQRNDLTEGAELTGVGNGLNGDDETSEDLSNTWCTSAHTAGILNACTPVVAPLLLVSEVQGPGLTTPEAGNSVRVEAIVVGDYQNDDQLSGFFIQEEDADADADSMTSEGVFVYCDTCPTDVAVGDLVDVTGIAVDFFGMTQIDVSSGGTISVVSSGNPLPTPATITLPAPAGTDLEGTFESVEGMLTTITTDLVVSEYFELARYGTLVLNANNRVKQFTDTNDPDVAGYAAFLSQLESSRIILDDDTNIQNDAVLVGPDEPYYYPRPGLSNTNLIRGGDQISNLTGVMHWSFSGQSGTDAWRIRPVEPAFSYDFTSANPRPAAPDAVGGTVKVASFNVLNYFTTLNERGANSIAELDRQREKIAAAICGLEADIVGLIEIENNGVTAINDLLNGTNGVNAICGTTYAAVNTGVIGTDEIAVAFIYNTATISLQGAFALLDNSVDPRFNDDKNRPALAQTFSQISTGAALTVVVNHLKSKGSPCDAEGDPDLNDGAGNCNIIRAEAAAAMVDWLATDPTASGDEDYLIIGDLNSYSKEDPIDNILAGPDDILGSSDDYSDLILDYQGPNAYSYVFDGQLGYLDYAMASSTLATQVTGTTVWHTNADEINVFDYNDDIQDTGESSFQRESSVLPVYEANAFRASDHDAILVGINLASPPTITCPADITIDNTPGMCSGTVSFPDAVASDPDGDLVSVIQTQGPVSGSTFPVGTTLIEFTATDAAGNTATCTFNVTVADTEMPVAVCQDITIQLDAAGNATITASEVDGGSTDNCGIASISVSNDTFDCTNVGTNNVTLTVTDVNGNVGTCIAVVTVEDVTAPTAVCQDITVALDATGMATITASDVDGGSTDGCAIASLAVDITEFDCTNLGENTVTLTITDVGGNTDTCTAIVTVIDDIAPVVSCMDITLALDENGEASITASDILDGSTDNCAVDVSSVDISDFDCSDIGTPVEVTVLVADASGNSAACTAIVTVVDDLAPVLTCPADQTVVAELPSDLYEVPDYFATGEATAVDNCTDPVTLTTQDPAAGTMIPAGSTTVTLTATDAFGNVATCSFEVEVDLQLGVGESDFENGITVYPNPASTEFVLVNGTNDTLKAATLFDVTGKMVKTINLTNMKNQQTIGISELASGVYLLQIEGTSNSTIKRIVKK
ncbi:ExeM/NucH family extracellular endonuclease [Rasiella rasia]|nr:ExeM/NucH family extracellular endonuclease [Rasiella rasia]